MINILDKQGLVYLCNQFVYLFKMRKVPPLNICNVTYIRNRWELTLKPGFGTLTVPYENTINLGDNYTKIYFCCNVNHPFKFYLNGIEIPMDIYSRDFYQSGEYYIYETKNSYKGNITIRVDV